ncbi:MAG: cob(I)yrinic acid a,c-diamide adenosyltransferase [Candidatus Latescibacterota bacterium]|nr:cob(I)yrinic acid a,c-diamide adenosyltransferase [Candidatus Latescibacterota bacterium]
MTDSGRDKTVVNLSRIYTGTGDAGTTRLGDGTRVAKTDLRIEAGGAVDELNACLGGAVAFAPSPRGRELLEAIQNHLFDLGADLTIPLPVDPDEKGKSRLRIEPDQVSGLEATIDEINEEIEPLRSFVLPGGGQVAAFLHLARTVCRRAERVTWALVERGEEINPSVPTYLNRLSDLLFVLARHENREAGVGEPLWSPGGGDREGGGSG